VKEMQGEKLSEDGREKAGRDSKVPMAKR